MERPQQQQQEGGKRSQTGEKTSLEGLPVESSPYTQYKDLEDYKRQGYGAQGHQQPVEGRGAGSTVDAPTLSGGVVSSEAQVTSAEAVHRAHK